VGRFSGSFLPSDSARDNPFLLTWLVTVHVGFDAETLILLTTKLRACRTRRMSYCLLTKQRVASLIALQEKVNRDDCVNLNFSSRISTFKRLQERI
jgi:hypothetical protein